jgi:hypothetical protein
MYHLVALIIAECSVVLVKLLLIRAVVSIIVRIAVILIIGINLFIRVICSVVILRWNILA